MPELNAIGIVASNLPASIAFYRLLGVDFPEDGEGHIEATLHETRGRVEGPHGAARLLRINPHTLRARMRKLNVDPRRFRPPRGE